MNEERDWRVKYREALRRLEAQEAQATALENALRLLVGRLCLAAQGRAAALDVELARVSGAVRRHSDAPQLEELIGPLSQAVAVLDAASPASPAPAAPVPAPSASADSAPAASPASATASAPPPAVGPSDVDTATVRLQDRFAHLQRERLELEDLVQQMTARLDEIEAYLANELADRDAVRDDTAQLNAAVTGEVEQLRAEALTADDILELRKRLTSRLDTIASQVQAFHAREDTRTATYRERVQRMRARIATLERESRNLHQSLKEGQQAAMIDALTGIPNRAAYDDRIEQEFKRWKRFGKPVSIVTWDVDRFKSVNDAYGHKAGDKVLRIVGQQLVRHVRDTDFVARYGGEEFVMLLVGTSLEEARLVAEKVRTEIAELGFHFHDQRVKVTASCGVTGFREGDTPETAFSRADKALYAAKKAGRNCCVVQT